MLSSYKHEDLIFRMVFTDDLKSEMSYVLCVELQSVQPLFFQQMFLGTYVSNVRLGLETGVEFNLFHICGSCGK